MDSSPFDQATRNRYDLRDHICEQTGIRGLPMGHAVVFTDGAPRGNLGPAAPAPIVVDGTELADLPAAVRRICAHWFPAKYRGLPEAAVRAGPGGARPTATVAADRQYAVDVTLIDVRQRTDARSSGRASSWRSSRPPSRAVRVGAWRGGHRQDDHRCAPCRRTRERGHARRVRRRPEVPARLSRGTADAAAPEHRRRAPRQRWCASSARTCRR